MKKLGIIASSLLALLGLVSCGQNDTTSPQTLNNTTPTSTINQTPSNIQVSTSTNNGGGIQKQNMKGKPNTVTKAS